MMVGCGLWQLWWDDGSHDGAQTQTRQRHRIVQVPSGQIPFAAAAPDLRATDLLGSLASPALNTALHDVCGHVSMNRFGVNCQPT